MRSAFDALELVGIALGTARHGLDAGDDRAVVVVEGERGGLSDLVEMSRVARTHDHARHARLIEHPTERHRADPDAVARRNRAKRRQHVLKAVPPAELVDDQAVLLERAVLERTSGIRATSITV